MSNPYFRFKEFTIFQEKCAMKVCTDSCLFGAYIADFIAKNDMTPKTILDIGGGTGLLSLMLAQKNRAVIDAVEIDPTGAIEMEANFRNSQWSDRLNAINSDILKFNSNVGYSFIISNPPFYQNQLRSADGAKTLARHDSGLTSDKLFARISELLAAKGKFAVMLPFPLLEKANEYICKSGLGISNIIRIRHSPAHPFFRVIIIGGIKKRKPDND